MSEYDRDTIKIILGLIFVLFGTPSLLILIVLLIEKLRR